MAKENALVKPTKVLKVYDRIPYSLIKAKTNDEDAGFVDEFTQILRYYEVYEHGVDFIPDGNAGDYLPSDLHFKLVANLINKESRFLFAEPPDIKVDTRSDTILQGEKTEEVDTVQEFINKVIEENKFGDLLLKASKDCFIGKRVACVVNFNEKTGVTLHFLRSTDFIYKFASDGSGKLERFVMFIVVNQNKDKEKKRIWVKEYEMVDDECWFKQEIYDGNANLVETNIPYQKSKLKEIPAYIFFNDGLLSDDGGKSEIEYLEEYERNYSRLSNADMDSERKSMHPIRYTVDMDTVSTEHLSSSPGSYWDLQSSDEKTNSTPSVGMMESGMKYNTALKETLNRIRQYAFAELDIPDIVMGQSGSTIVNGKALKAAYWPLIVRCKEKMQTWAPGLEFIFNMVLDGARLYPNTIKKYTPEALPIFDYELHIIQNFPLPEDQMEEKQMDVVSVQANVMSRKSYMRKWLDMGEAEADAELEQIAYESSILSGDLLGLLDTQGAAADAMKFADSPRKNKYSERNRASMNPLNDQKKQVNRDNTSFENTVKGARKELAEQKNKTFGPGQTLLDEYSQTDTNADRRRKNSPSVFDTKPKKKAGGR